MTIVDSKNFSVYEKPNNYIVIAKFFESDMINVQIAYKEKNIDENLFIINEFPIKPETDEIFKALYFNYCSNEKIAEFVDFFTHNKKFYVVFKYKRRENISKFSKETNVANFDVRLRILEKILMKFQLLQERFPDYVVSSVTNVKNVMVDENNEVGLVYSLQNIFDYKKRIEDIPKKGDAKYMKRQGQRFIFENINDIIHIMLKREIKPFYNFGLKIVSKKCKSNIYKSIPQMFIELKKSANLAKNTTILSYLWFKFNQRKVFYMGILKTALTILIFCVAGNIVVSNLTSGLTSSTSPVAVEIGNEVYNASVEDKTSKEVAYEATPVTVNTEDMSNVKLAPGLDLPYEDYIVQYDDTLESICEAYYQNKTYKTCVATFNDIGENDILTAGSILRLPNKTAIAYQVA